MVRRLPHPSAVIAALAVSCTTACTTLTPTAEAPTPPPRAVVEDDSLAWLEPGQGSVALAGRTLSSDPQPVVPIASVAKVMTAYVTVRHLPPSARLTVDAADVADTARRRARGESVVRVVRGEVLSRDQALAALLIPSANNVAVMLADRVSGSQSRFVDLMNSTAYQLGMIHTTYTDPSGYRPSTVSTARDQLLLLRSALRSPVLARTMGMRTTVLPVAGQVKNTNTLLGHQGFVAGKTGTTDAAGGCVVFRVIRAGRVLDGAVLGQPGGRTTALRVAAELANGMLGQPPTGQSDRRRRP
jgi:D-alanyl-D-alanine carboxypeptidase (penicillin-binding protein 5/6)